MEARIREISERIVELTQITSVTEDKAADIADKVIKEMDSMTLLGAAFDCMSDAAQQRFKNKVTKIVLENS